MADLPKAAEVAHRVHDDLVRLIDDTGAMAEERARAEDLPEKVETALERVVEKADSYRDALLVLLAYPVIAGEPIDITARPNGARAAGDAVGGLLPGLHIRGVRGAFQNIGKNSPDLVRGNNEDFDLILRWASTEAALDELSAAYSTVVAEVAGTARRVEARPKLRMSRLTFPNVMALLDEVLRAPSQGANEQYVAAALLEAALAQESSVSRRVETKGMSASDRSAKTAGDIEVFERGRLQEGIEVTANRWQEKLEQARQSMASYGLPRSHILASIDEEHPYEALAELAEGADISVLDVRAVVALLTALLDRGGREHALLRIYELLDRYVADPGLVNEYVRLLRNRGLCA
jgi:hypothetical protein